MNIKINKMNKKINKIRIMNIKNQILKKLKDMYKNGNKKTKN